ncbi:uncharacterized protein LOC135388711 [Ornithodoros turicata]|uniref:uncharacterized protein LOC135388711 n=1 Tax=Ornithodoros turicata TaxID=34597 RepID=UPI0031394B2A
MARSRKGQPASQQCDKPKVADSEDDGEGNENPGPDIQCEICRRWVFLDETPFDDMDAAVKSPFKCRICTMMDVSREILLAKIEEEKQARLRVEEQLSALRSEYTVLETRLLQTNERSQVNQTTDDEQQRKDLAEEVKAIQIQLAKYQDDRVTPEQLRQAEQVWTKRAEDEEQKRNSLEKKVQTLRNACCKCMIAIGETHTNDEQQPHTNASKEGKNEPIQGMQVGANEDPEKDEQAMNPQKVQLHSNFGEFLEEASKYQSAVVQPRSKRRLSTHHKTLEETTLPVEDGDAQPAHTSQDRAESHKLDRQVIIAGDSNIQRTKSPTLAGVDHDKRVEVIGIPGASISEILEQIEQRLKKDTKKNLVIIHAGLVDILNDAENQTVITDLRNKLKQWLPEFPNTLWEVCPIPKGTGDPSLDNLIPTICELNEDLENMCNELGHNISYVDPSWHLRECLNGGFQGIHLSRDGSHILGNWFARKVNVFFGPATAISTEEMERTDQSAGQQMERASQLAGQQMERASQLAGKQMGRANQLAGQQTGPIQGPLQTDQPDTDDTPEREEVAAAQNILDVTTCQENGVKRRSEKRRLQQQRRRRKKGRRGTQRREHLKIAFLNIQGGRQERKWLEMTEVLHSEKLAAFMVAETHLRDDETPPTINGFAWEGLNRVGGERRGGGIGFLGSTARPWRRFKQNCSEHMWIETTLNKRKLAIAGVYWWTGAQEEKNITMAKCLEKDIEDLKKTHDIMILGDFNAHLEELDGRLDKNGQRLLNIAENHDLIIANLTVPINAPYTWTQ